MATHTSSTHIQHEGTLGFSLDHEKSFSWNSRERKHKDVPEAKGQESQFADNWWMYRQVPAEWADEIRIGDRQKKAQVVIDHWAMQGMVVLILLVDLAITAYDLIKDGDVPDSIRFVAVLVLIALTGDVILRLFALRLVFFRSALNVFEVIIVVVSICFYFFEMGTGPAIGRSLRPGLRVIRGLRLAFKTVLGHKRVGARVDRAAKTFFINKYLGGVLNMPPDNVTVWPRKGLIRLEKALIEPDEFVDLHLPFTIKGGFVELVHIDLAMGSQTVAHTPSPARSLSDYAAKKTRKDQNLHRSSSSLFVSRSCPEVVCRNMLLVIGKGHHQEPPRSRWTYEDVVRNKARLIDLLARYAEIFIPRHQKSQKQHNSHASLKGAVRPQFVDHAKYIARHALVHQIRVDIKNVMICYEDGSELFSDNISWCLRLGALRLSVEQGHPPAPTGSISHLELDEQDATEEQSQPQPSEHLRAYGTWPDTLSRAHPPPDKVLRVVFHVNRMSSWLDVGTDEAGLYGPLLHKKPLSVPEATRRFKRSNLTERLKVSLLRTLEKGEVTDVGTDRLINSLKRVRFEERLFTHRYIIKPTDISVHGVMRPKNIGEEYRGSSSRRRSESESGVSANTHTSSSSRRRSQTETLDSDSPHHAQSVPTRDFDLFVDNVDFTLDHRQLGVLRSLHSYFKRWVGDDKQMQWRPAGQMMLGTRIHEKLDLRQRQVHYSGAGGWWRYATLCILRDIGAQNAATHIEITHRTRRLQEYRELLEVRTAAMLHLEIEDIEGEDLRVLTEDLEHHAHSFHPKGRRDGKGVRWTPYHERRLQEAQVKLPLECIIECLGHAHELAVQHGALTASNILMQGSRRSMSLKSAPHSISATKKEPQGASTIVSLPDSSLDGKGLAGEFGPGSMAAGRVNRVSFTFLEADSQSHLNRRKRHVRLEVMLAGGRGCQGAPKHIWEHFAPGIAAQAPSLEPEESDDWVGLEVSIASVSAIHHTCPWHMPMFRHLIRQRPSDDEGEDQSQEDSEATSGNQFWRMLELRGGRCAIEDPIVPSQHTMASQASDVRSPLRNKLLRWVFTVRLCPLEVVNYTQMTREILDIVKSEDQVASFESASELRLHQVRDELQKRRLAIHAERQRQRAFERQAGYDSSRMRIVMRSGGLRIAVVHHITDKRVMLKQILLPTFEQELIRTCSPPYVGFVGGPRSMPHRRSHLDSEVTAHAEEPEKEPWEEPPPEELATPSRSLNKRPMRWSARLPNCNSLQPWSGGVRGTEANRACPAVCEPGHPCYFSCCSGSRLVKAVQSVPEEDNAAASPFPDSPSPPPSQGDDDIPSPEDFDATLSPEDIWENIPDSMVLINYMRMEEVNKSMHKRGWRTVHTFKRNRVRSGTASSDGATSL